MSPDTFLRIFDNSLTFSPQLESLRVSLTSRWAIFGTVFEDFLRLSKTTDFLRLVVLSVTKIPDLVQGPRTAVIEVDMGSQVPAHLTSSSIFMVTFDF